MTSKYTINDSPVYINDNMTGKMTGIPAISTSPRLNPICQARAKNGYSVCSKCFAMRTTARYKSLEKRLEENYELLTSRVLDLDELPRFNKAIAMVRIEAFGDLVNKTQATNYLNIIRANPHIHFAWWTKNLNFIEDALARSFKPDNVQVVYSSPQVNKRLEMVSIKPWAPFVDKVFTVYDKDYIEDHKVKINCGGKSCSSCGLCYFNKSVTYINEQLK